MLNHKNKTQIIYNLTEELFGNNDEAKIRADQILEKVENEDNLIIQAAVTLESLKKTEAEIFMIEKKYFTAYKGFKKGFGIMLFPFLTFFISSIEILEIDAKKMFFPESKKFFWRFRRISNKKFIQLLNEWEIRNNQQLEGIQNSSAEEFVWMFYNLLHDIKTLEGDEYQQKNSEILVNKLTLRTKPFFNYHGVNREVESIIEMGQFLGSKAQLCMPNKELMVYKIKKMKTNKFIDNLVDMLEVEREKFQNSFEKELRPYYNEMIAALEKDWQDFLKKHKERKERITIYLQMLAS